MYLNDVKLFFSLSVRFFFCSLWMSFILCSRWYLAVDASYFANFTRTQRHHYYEMWYCENKKGMRTKTQMENGEMDFQDSSFNFQSKSFITDKIQLQNSYSSKHSSTIQTTYIYMLAHTQSFKAFVKVENLWLWIILCIFFWFICVFIFLDSDVKVWKTIVYGLLVGQIATKFCSTKWDFPFVLTFTLSISFSVCFDYALHFGS